MPSDCRCERSAKWSYLPGAPKPAGRRRVAREARQVEHDDEVDAALVQTAVREQALKLAAVRRLRALAFLVKALEHIVALAAAVLLARAELCRQAEVLGLLLRADANVDHRADHKRQIRSVRGHGQGAYARHGSTRKLAAVHVESRPGSRPLFPRDDGRPPLSWSGNRFGLRAEQFTAARNRNRIPDLSSGSSTNFMALHLNASRDDSCWMGGALWRVDVAVDAPMSV